MLLLISALLLIRTPVAPDPAQEIIRLEQQLADALVQLDTRTIESLWADDLIFVGTNGKAFSKLERLSGMKAPLHRPSLQSRP
jgi:hypothetical protein